MSAKIVLMGAASAFFGATMVNDAVLTPEVKGSTLVLVDVDAERLEVIGSFARRVNEALGAGLHIEHTTDRARALAGADFVLNSVAVKTDELWQLDFQIPLKYGIKQVQGGNGGPGGLARAMRHIPMVLGVAKDMEKHCPDALLINFTNPECQIGLALSRYSSIRWTGLCTGVVGGRRSIARIMGLQTDDVEGMVAGLNHIGWFVDLRHSVTKEDLYPRLRAAEATYDPTFAPLSRYLLHRYGLWPYPGGTDSGEFLSYAWEIIGLKGYNFQQAEGWRSRAWEWITRVAQGKEAVPQPQEIQDALEPGQPGIHRSREFALPIIAATVANQHRLIEAVNLVNGGLIPNLPGWAVVEIPAVVGADGIKGVRMGALPRGIAAVLNTAVYVQDLVVEAAVHGSRELALQALLADPVVQSADAAEKVLDELLKVHAPYLPQFKH